MMDKHAAHAYMSAGAEALGEMDIDPQIKVATLRLMQKEAGLNPFKVLKDAYRAVRAPKGAPITVTPAVPATATSPAVPAVMKDTLSRTGAALTAIKDAPLAAAGATAIGLGGIGVPSYIGYDQLIAEPERERQALARARLRREEESRKTRNLMLGLGALGITAGAGTALYNKYKNK